MEVIDNNKLGIYSDIELKKIEYHLFNTKYHLIDESFNFNSDSLFDVDYLEKIHLFLFSDIYNEDICKIRESEKIKEEANKILNEINEMLVFNDMEHLGEEIYKLWELQMFLDGNTRAILCYLKVLSRFYNFNMTYDFSKDVTEDYFIDKVIDSIKPKKYY